MKKLFKRIKKTSKDEKGQGAIEYILLLVVVIGIVILFKGQIGQRITDAIGKIGTEIGNVDANL